MRLAGRPRLRLEEPPRVGECLHEPAPLGGPVDRLEEREEPTAIRRRGGLAHRVAERPVLRLAARGEAGGVRGEEGERALGIARVLGEVEVHASDGAPGRVLRREPLLDGAGRRAQLGAPGLEQARPERPQDVGREVLAARHRRSSRGEPLELALARRRLRALSPLLQIGQRAQRRDEATAEVAPEGEDRGEGGPRLGGAQVEQARGGASLEGRADAASRGRFGLGLVRLGGADEDVARRGEDDCEGIHGSPDDTLTP